MLCIVALRYHHYRSGMRGFTPCKNERRLSLRQSDVLHLDSTVPQTALTRATHHSLYVRVFSYLSYPLHWHFCRQASLIFQLACVYLYPSSLLLHLGPLHTEDGGTKVLQSYHITQGQSLPWMWWVDTALHVYIHDILTGNYDCPFPCHNLIWPMLRG
jgi:hypothetical protein